MVIIAYEGKSDEKFLDDLLSEYELQKDAVIYYDFEGKDKLFDINHRYYDEIKQKHLSKIKKMLLIVDADNKKDPNPNRGYKASEKKLQEIINNLDFDIVIDYYIMCDDKKEGNLESFLLSVLDDEQKECIDKFRKCYKYDLTDKWAYNTFYKQKKEPFNFSHTNFDELKQKLINLLKD
ncbi:MAG: Unknown protein [uncultured Campylobacterales bacterium]|uniref:DUF4276 family protein n=1 Tax=uncultured Campylobacterales bacterium TaxID=352960 RepID=A0A6S6SPF5_9BACT|nr:MAG: Unknown protein [uncultured Campylobacterales bacterium]